MFTCKRLPIPDDDGNGDKSDEEKCQACRALQVIGHVEISPSIRGRSATKHRISG